MRKVCRGLEVLIFAIVVTTALLVPWGTDVALDGTAPTVIKSLEQAPGAPTSVATLRSIGVVVPKDEHSPAFLNVDLLPQPASVTQVEVVEAYGQLPLHFEANQGQTNGQVKFVAHSRSFSLFLTLTEAVLVLNQPRKLALAPDAEEQARMQKYTSAHSEPPHPANQTASTVLRMHLVGANPTPDVVGLQQLPSRMHYFLGNDLTQWHANIPTYARVMYRDVYPGIDMVYYGHQRQLEYDFVVAPGADPNTITLAFDGAYALAINAQGDLVLKTADGEFHMHTPFVYQDVDGVRQAISGHYILLPRSLEESSGNDQQHIGLRVAAYDARIPLVIDPVLSYSTYLGGSGDDQGLDITVDAAGNAYVTGVTSSPNFPTQNPQQPALNGATDVFVAKLNPTGTALIYCTYLGGSGSDAGRGIAVDTAGNAYITGETTSTDFPTTAGVFQPIYGGGVGDAFVAKLRSDGAALVYATYLGGSSNDQARAITVDTAGDAYVAGRTASTNFPIVHPIQPVHGGAPYDAFIVKVNSTGSALLYGTYLGGDGDDGAYGMAIDTSGNAYVAGYGSSTDLPTKNPIQPMNGGSYDAFVAKLQPDGSALVYSTYLGGSDIDYALGIGVDTSGNAYVTGATKSTDFPTKNPLQPTLHGSYDVFVARLNPTGAALVYSTYLGGSSDDEGFGIAVDTAGNAYVTGLTASTDFPTVHPIQPTYGGGSSDAFVAKVDTTGSALVYATYLGGSGTDSSGNTRFGGGIAVDTSGSAYITGFTNAIDFPTAHPLQPALGGGSDAFIVKIALDPIKPVCDIQMSKPSYITSDMVIVQVLRVVNPTMASLVIEYKLWFEGPGLAPFSFMRGGADGSFVLKAGFDHDFGPLMLGTVTPALTRGDYTFNCRFVDPVTGKLLTEDLNPFTIQ